MLVIAAMVGTSVWYFFIRADRFPHEYSAGGSTVSLDSALSEHRITIPSSASGVGYYANDEVEDHLLRLDFVLPCGDVQSMMEINGLLAVDGQTGLSDASVVTDAREHGWSRRSDDVFAERPKSPALGELTAMFAHEAGTCHVYLDALI
ncbi:MULTISPECIES: hypothetical protein [unclassified Streptomyces]|uniref:hypothetical protein n=1 Tax=unclassified Streptomyces TaxID=2593676 RepID=UPI002E2B0EEA|nr:hypothetical protein [Streptomyces sp. NBC_00223]